MEQIVVIKKNSQQLIAYAQESDLYLPLPLFVERTVRTLSNRFLNRRILVGKILYTETIMHIMHYIPYQLAVGATVALGSCLAPLRYFFRYFKKNEIKTQNSISSLSYSLFPGTIHAVVYRNHIPIPFMPFQVDKTTIATSLQDIEFAKKAVHQLKLSGFRTMSWASNYLLGYQKRFFVKKRLSKKDLTKALSSTVASVAGYNTGLKNMAYFRNAIEKKYAEESFKTNTRSIHFAPHNNSPIIKAVTVEKQGATFKIALCAFNQTLQVMRKKSTVSVIYPLALLTNSNASHPHWDSTPTKNVSGFIIAFDKTIPICIALSSTSLIRIKINKLLPIINKICLDAHVNFFCYVHTDDGGAVGDFYLQNNSLKQYGPRWGHCMSSLVGFSYTNNVVKTNKALQNWSL